MVTPISLIQKPQIKNTAIEEIVGRNVKLLIKKKMRQDPEYRENQARAYEDWKQRNPNYWKEYRKENPEYTNRNRLLQRNRNLRRKQVSQNHSCPDQEIAKMESPNKNTPIKSGNYRLIPAPDDDIANMEGTIVKIEIISDD